MIGIISYSHGDPFRVAGGLSAKPLELKNLLLNATLDAAFISATAFLDNRAILEPLPLGIASTKVGSVLLFGTAERVQAHPDSETARELLQLLTGCRFVEKDPTGILLIGDDALHYQSPLPVTDLAQLWHTHTGLPFVFALLAKRKDRPFDYGPLLQSLDSYPQNAYHRNLDYRLTETHFRSLALFDELRQHPDHVLRHCAAL